MEALVVTLETAQKLKAAGFSQRTCLLWFLDTHPTSSLGSFVSASATETEYFKLECAAPTAQEIADQLPISRNLESGTGYLQCGPIHRSRAYWAAYETPVGPEVQEVGAYMAEALAALWLDFHEATA